MELLAKAIFVLVVAAWLIVVGSWFGTIVEFMAVRYLAPWAFRAGRVVLRETRPSPPPAVEEGIVKTVHGQLRFLSDMECIFCDRGAFSLFAIRLHTPFPIKGRIVWKQGVATIEGRIPLAPSIFFGGLLASCTAIGVLGAVTTPGLQELPPRLVPMIVAWAVVAPMYFFSIPLEVSRAREVVDEILGQPKEHGVTGGTA